jgi:hypothetical protein
MSVAINPPKTPVTKGSNGIAAATTPNVCKMPGPPAPFVPTPLPNIGKSGDSPKGYSKQVRVEGQPVAIAGSSFGSVGDVASKASGGGLVSQNTQGPTTFVGPGSLDVSIEGKRVQLLGDPMLNNCGPSGTPANAATMVGVMQPSGLIVLVGDEFCALCRKTHGEEGKLAETQDTQADADALRTAAERAVKRAQAELARRWEQERARLQQKAQQNYEKKKKKLGKQLARARAKGGAEAVAKAEAKLAGLKPRVVKSDGRTASLTAMLGVVRCKDGQVFAGTSLHQYVEIAAEAPAGWHVPPGAISIVDKNSEFADRLEDFLAHVDEKERFSESWGEMLEMNLDFRNKKIEEPHYPPGQCAAQQVILLALEHGGRPVGLTERWYKFGNPNSTVEVFVRDAPDAPARLGSFGGSTAVPPCGTCQVILTMLMCPQERPPECQHRSPTAGVCRCT